MTFNFGDAEIDEVLQKWERRPTANNPTWQPVLQDNACQRCGRRVYPLEKVDVGVLYHRSCFKCKVCGRQLTLKTFQRQLCPTSGHQNKEIFCEKHVPQPLKGHMGQDALAIKSAVDAQRRVHTKVYVDRDSQTVKNCMHHLNYTVYRWQPVKTSHNDF